MTPTLNKRNTGIYHFSAHIGGRRLRGSLGTKDAQIAKRRVSQLDLALQDPRSDQWTSLKLLLPPATTKSLCRALLGPPATIPIRAVEMTFIAHLERQVSLGRMAQSTLKTYEGRVGLFFDYLEGKIQIMDSVTPKLLEDYQLHRAAEIAARPQTTNGRSILMDVSAIKSLLKFCVEENLMAEIKFPEVPQPKGEVQGAEPFTAEELQKMENCFPFHSETRLAFLLFRWTGMRRSDLAMLRWKHIDLTAQTVHALTQKRQKAVTIPLAPQLYGELRAQNDLRKPGPEDKVLPGFTRDSLYNMVVSLGKRCGILEAYPHRFRSTFVVYLLEKGVPIFEVAKMIGDSPATLGQAYAKFTDKMVDNVRRVFEEGS